MFEEGVKILFGGNTDDVAVALRGIKGIAEKTAHSMSESFKAAWHNLAAPLSVAGVISGVEKVFGKVEDIERTAAATGMATEQLQRFSYATKSAGVDAEQTEKVLAHLSARIGEARTGSSEAIAVFQKWGVSLNNSNGVALDTGKILDNVSDVMAGMEDQTQRAAMAMDMLGKSSEKMVSILAEGSAKLHARGANAAIFSDGDIQNIKDAREEIEKWENRGTFGLGKLLVLMDWVKEHVQHPSLGGGIDTPEIGIQSETDWRNQIWKAQHAMLERQRKERQSSGQTGFAPAVEGPTLQQQLLLDEISKAEEKRKTTTEKYNDALALETKLQDELSRMSPDLNFTGWLEKKLALVNATNLALELQRQLENMPSAAPAPYTPGGSPDAPAPAGVPMYPRALQPGMEPWDTPHYAPDPSYKPFQPMKPHIPWPVNPAPSNPPLPGHSASDAHSKAIIDLLQKWHADGIPVDIRND